MGTHNIVGETKSLEGFLLEKPCIGKIIIQAILIILGITMLLSPIIVVCLGGSILSQESMIMVSLIVFIMGVIAITSVSLSEIQCRR
ncbi:hypothetical protein [Chlamydia sp. 17-3921]|uniref:hypothetical protein n=1 Tax=Chlamydia sp. 17-3921 TaxID=2675798 RepID=UPI00191883B1|nr:hypothetical protein [Chlamydia sp. 17-3921]